MPLGHCNRGIEGAVVRRQVKRRRRHVPLDRLAEITGAVGHHMAQIAQGENTQRRLVFIDDHDAADLLLVHLGHGFAQGRVRAARHRMAHGQFTQAGVERVLGAEGFHGFLLHLLIDLIQQAAHAS
ncbi:hypothetical protein D3C76_1271980 [compost metagenome]